MKKLKDTVRVFKEIAFSGKSVSSKDIDIHSHEKQLEKRFRRAKRACTFVDQFL